MEREASQNKNTRRHSIRDIKIDRNQNSRGRNRLQQSGDTTIDEGQERAPRRRRRGLLSSAGWWVLAVVILIATSLISLPIVFSDTTINIKPVITRATFEGALFTALREGSDDVLANSLTFNTLEWTVSESLLLEPTSREQVTQKASGFITVYNNHTTSKQRLIKNTRFETSNGKVYRVRESIIVPGKKVEGGKTIPGSLRVRVYADDYGPSYNNTSIGAQLTLPGLKSLKDMHQNIYAKIDTALVGGYDGMRAVVTQGSKSAASNKLQASIESKVRLEVSSRIPEDSRYFDDAIYITFADTTESEVDGKVQVLETATVHTITFNRILFANTLADEVAVGNPESGNASIREPEDIVVLVDNSGFIPKESDVLKITVNGDADFIWTLNEENLKADLAGRHRDILRTVLTGYPTIDEAEAIIRPFWRSTFPKNVNDITVKIINVE